MKIVTHKGPAHMDDFMAVCCLLWHFATKGINAVVERRDATEDDLEDLDTVAVDQGGRYEPEKGNFDHHQFPRDAEPACSLTLLNDHFGWGLEVFDWYRPMSILDSKGPKQYQAALGLSPQAFDASLSPVDASIKEVFWKDTEAVLPVMKLIGRSTLEKGAEIRDDLDWALANHEVVQVVGGHSVVLLDPSRSVCPGALKGVIRGVDPAPVATVSLCPRDGGMSLFRLDDHPAVDFARVSGDGDILFAHNNGFVAKTKPGVTDKETTMRLLAKAIS